MTASRGGMLLVLWLCWPGGSAAAPLEFSGIGSARIVGGNQVSARQRALREAHRQAVNQALATMLDDKDLRRLAPQLRRVAARHEAFVRNYRVIAENQVGMSFEVEVAVVLDLKRLRQEINKISGIERADPAGGSVRLAWRTTGKTQSVAVTQELIAELRDAGFDPVRVADRRAARQATAPALLSFELSIEGAPGVRGLQLAGAHAVVRLEARLTGDGALLAERKGEGWGVGETDDRAQRAATLRALRDGLGPLLEVLRSRWPGRREGKEQLVVQITGLTSPLQHEQIQRALTRQIAGVRRCRPQRLTAGSAWFSLETALDAARLAEALQRQPFDFRLRSKSITAGVAWLEVEPLPPTSQPSDLQGAGDESVP